MQVHITNIEFNLQDYQITSCFPKGSKFCFVMTKGAPDYDASELQATGTHDSWSELEDFIKRQKKNGKIITALSYSNMTEEYIAVMTESEQRQYHSWGDSSCKDGYKPTIIFQDPSDGEILYVKTKYVDIGSYIVRNGYDIVK